MLPGKENSSEEATESFQEVREISEGQGGATIIDEMKKGNNEKGLSLEQLGPLEFQYLNKIVSLVHERVNVSDQKQDLVPDSSVFEEDSQENKRCTSYVLTIDDDPLASILHKMKPLTLRNVFLSMVRSFPRTLEALVLRSLSPLTAEILTRKFEKLDQQSTKEEQLDFYQQVYGVFDDQFSAMDSILNLKESFAFKAFQNVINKYLGVDVSKPNQ